MIFDKKGGRFVEVAYLKKQHFVSNKIVSNKQFQEKILWHKRKLKNFSLLLSTTSLTACGGDEEIIGGGSAVTPDFVESPTGVFTASNDSNLTLLIGARTDDVTVYSGNGNDTIATGSGDDIILGEAGDDEISAGLGNDQITTGTGNDTIFFSSGFGVDVITDFENRSDIIDFSGTGLEFDDLTITQVGLDVRIEDGSGNILILESEYLGNISAADFIFANTQSGSVIISGIAMEDEVLTASNTLSDENGMGPVSYQWQRDGVDIDGATSNTYTLVQDDVGAEITVIASYEDGEGTDKSVASFATNEVINVSHLPTGEVTITGIVTEGQVLTASNTLADEDGLGDITYQWQRNGVNILGATDDTYTLVQADVDKVITIVARYTDGEGTIESVVSENTRTVVNVSHSTTGSVTITGTAIEGNTLTASHALEDLDGLGDVSYQWQRDGVDIVGATNDSYLLVQDDVDAVITVIASHTDGEGADESVSSFGTAAVSELSVLQLSSLDGSFGFRIDGQEIDDQTGLSVSGIGDFNGDGYDDLIIGAPYFDHGGLGNAGASYVLFGTDADFGADESLGAEFDLSKLNGVLGFRLDGVAIDDQSGWSVSSAGDFNGDGLDDLIVGAWGADPNGGESGSSYVVYGTASNMGASFDLAGLNGTNGFRIDGAAAGDESGYSVSSAGDVNGDGFDDIIIGAYSADPNGAASGSSYVVFGTSDNMGASFDLSGLDGTDGFRLDGVVADDQSGWSVSSVGDFNNDGFDDLVVGAYSADPDGLGEEGASYVIFGSDDWTADSGIVNLDDLDGADGFRLDGDTAGDESGYSVSNAGDVNGDGFDDLIIGARSAGNNGALSGSTYIMFGTNAGVAASVNLSGFNGTNGFRLDGAAAGDEGGYSVSSAGDINGDGFDDLIIGAWGADYNGEDSGSTYVLFGSDAAFSASIDLSGLDGTNGFRIDGDVAGDRSGISVSGAGDINGDGYDDLIIGADGADPNGSESGAAYVVYGGTQWTASVDTDGKVVTGDNDANVLLATSFDDILYGLDGDDILIGGAGSDILYGGKGADELQGGGNQDTFSFEYGDSVLTITGVVDDGVISGYDTITDFETGNGTDLSEIIDIGEEEVAIIAGDGDFDGANSTLTINGSTIKSHSITDGIITFDDEDTFGEALEISTNSEIAAVIEYLQNNHDGANGVTTAFDVGSDTFIYTKGETTDDDILIRLEGVQADSLIDINGTGEFDLYVI